MRPFRLSRRALLGAPLGFAPLVACSRFERSEPESRRATALAPSFTIAASIPRDDKYYYMHDPGMTVLPSGRILVAAPCLGQSTTNAPNVDGSVRTFISTSDDGGLHWNDLVTLPYSDATPFVHNGTLAMFVQRKKWEDVSLVTSTDEGKTWTDPVVLFRGVYWNCCTSMAVTRDTRYWALQTDDPSYREAGLVVIAAPLSSDIRDPRAWRMSNKLAHPSTPPALVRGDETRPAWWGSNIDEWLEPNVVDVRGHVRVMLRTIVDGYGTSGACAVCDVDDDGASLTLKFAQFYPMPGAQNKFFILFDPPSRLFWMLANLPADAQGAVFDWDAVHAEGHFLPGPGNDRRFLMLFYSVDAMSWFPAGCVARAPSLAHSFMYPAGAIEGDDLILISRSSLEGRNQHDADAVTFHRVPQFRSLAMNLYP